MSAATRRKISAKHKERYGKLQGYMKFGYIGLVFKTELKHFRMMQLRVRQDKMGRCSWPNTREGFTQFMRDFGPIPAGMARPSIGRIDHKRGYLKGNCDWEPFLVNCAKNGAAVSKKRWRDPAWIKKMSAATKARWRDPAARAHFSRIMKKAWRDGVFKNRKRRSTLAQVLLATLPVLLLSACAALPDKARLVAEHSSHLSQHFGVDPTDYGYNDVAVELGWKRGPWFADVSEGIVLNRKTAGWEEYGAMAGPREIFHVRTGLEISLK